MKLDMIGLTVSNINESVRFYRTLGWEIPDPKEGEPYHETTLPNGLRVSWNDVEMMKGIDPEWQQPVGQSIGLGFLCESVEDVDAKYKEIQEAGFVGRRDPWDAFWGQRYAQVADPDGNVVDLFHPIA
jgi:uncharacterized glyoxalase superfamily protein PhnB